MSETANWAWQARDGSGELRRGTLAAANAAEVADRLRAEGRTVIAIDRSVGAERSRGVRGSTMFKRVDREAVASMIRRLSVMLEAGVTLPEALSIEIETNPGLQVELETIRDAVEGGTPPSEAFEAFPRLFPPVATGLLRAAEAVGDLPGMLGRLADWMQRERRLSRQVRTALTYPVMLAVVGTVITLLLVTLVMPRFEAIYASRQAELPPITQFVLAFGRGVVGGWAAWGPALLASLAGLALLLRTSSGVGILEWLRFEVPVVRSVVRPADLARATRTLGLLLAAGVPLLDAIEICRGMSRWPRWRRFWDGLESAVRDGENLAGRFRSGGMVPASVRAMVAAGERSGKLPEVLERVADAADEDLEVAVKRVGVVLEPAAILVLGSVIGVVAIALLLPIFKMGSTMG
ncbi:MAG: type II secretion system F family protein [Planctomycetota bacterium]|nr:type II secretion system F family protein [Planctomycetota bacterium]